MIANLLRASGRFLIRNFVPMGSELPILRGPLRGMRFVTESAAGAGGGGSVLINLSEPEQTRIIINHLRPGDVFFDVGANVGYYSLIGSKLVQLTGKVVAFEPLVRNIEYLARHMRINRIKNVIIFPCACSRRNDWVWFREGQNCATGKIADVASEVDSRSELLLVPTIPIDDVVTSLDLVPKLMKIDVEGAELDVLCGAERLLGEHRPLVLLSTHSDELRERCSEYLDRFGYILTPINAATVGKATEFLCRA